MVLKMAQNQKTAIIIGAGPAGLTAAYYLLKETDVHPIVLEESEYIGGISRTVVFEGNRMDIGGHRFFSKNDEVMKLWKDIMPVQGAPALDDKILDRKVNCEEDGPDPEQTDRVMLLRHRVSRIFYLRKFFDYPISMKAATFINMGFTKTMKAGFGYISAKMYQRDEKSLRDFMINRFGKPLYKMFFEGYTKKVWGRDPRDISADWGAQRIKGLSLSKAILDIFKRSNSIEQKNVETSLINQFMYPKKGPGQFWETMAEDIKTLGGEVLLNTKVIKINAAGSYIRNIEVEDKNGRHEVEGDYYLSSMAIKDFFADLNPAPCDAIKDIAIQLPYRDFITVGVLVNKLKIKNTSKLKTLSNIVPDCWIYVQEPDVKIGRLQIFNNWSPYMVEDPENTVWIGLEYFCDEGDDMWTMSYKDFIDFAVNELCSIDIIEKEDVRKATRVKVKKAYPAYFGSYERFGSVKEYLDKFDNLFCIGRNGQHRYNNMDHSMLTAIAAVNCIKAGTTDKTSVWSVNTEEEYHEK